MPKVGIKISLNFFIIVVTASLGISQGNTTVKDFNNDRSFDFLVEGMEWLDIDHWDYVITDGKTGKRWGYANSIDYFGPASFISIGKSRNELDSSWDPVIDAIEDTLIHTRTEPDPSLEWVLNAESINHSRSGSIFDRVVRFEKKWYPGEPIIALNYNYPIDPEELEKLLGAEADPGYVVDSNDTYYMYYRSHNHKDESRIPDQFYVNGETFHKTKHALIEFHEGRYSWIFMSGVSHTGGPSKLRWPSIIKVLKHEGFLFLQQSVVVGEFSFWVGNLNVDNDGKAVWAKIRNERMDGWADFRIEGGRLILSDRDGEATEISIDDILSQIKNI